MRKLRMVLFQQSTVVPAINCILFCRYFPKSTYCSVSVVNITRANRSRTPTWRTRSSSRPETSRSSCIIVSANTWSWGSTFPTDGSWSARWPSTLVSEQNSSFFVRTIVRQPTWKYWHSRVPLAKKRNTRNTRSPLYDISCNLHRNVSRFPFWSVER